MSSIPDSIPGIRLGIGIEQKGIVIALELTKYAGINKGIDFIYLCLFFKRH